MNSDTSIRFKLSSGYFQHTEFRHNWIFTPETLNQGKIKEKISFQKNLAKYKENTSLFAKDLPALLSFLHLETYLFFLLSS